MKNLRIKFNERVYRGFKTIPKQDTELIVARKYAFWLIHEKYPEYQDILTDIKKEKQLIEARIEAYDSEARKRISLIVDTYSWKEDTYEKNG